MAVNPRKEITSIIDDANDLTIATIREDGFPQATTVSYVNDGTTIYFGTSANSQKARNIAQNNKVSLTIDRPYNSWAQIKSLSMAALATKVTNPEEQEKVQQLLFKKFPQISDHVPEDDMDVAFIRVDPFVVSVLDYSKGFGHTELVALNDD